MSDTNQYVIHSRNSDVADNSDLRYADRYIDSRDEAEEAFRLECGKGNIVDMLYGTPGNYKTVKKNYAFVDGHFTIRDFSRPIMEEFSGLLFDERLNDDMRIEIWNLAVDALGIPEKSILVDDGGLSREYYYASERLKGFDRYDYMSLEDAVNSFDSDKFSKKTVDLVIEEERKHYSVAAALKKQQQRQEVQEAVFPFPCDTNESEFWKGKTSNVDLPMDGFRKAVERYAEDGEHGQCGDWKIQKIGDNCIDCQISFDSRVVVECRPDNSSGAEAFTEVVIKDFSLGHEPLISNKSYKEIFDSIHSEFPDYKMGALEQNRIRVDSLGR